MLKLLCPPAVLSAQVGYGTTDAEKDYWHIKNSWSQAWGFGGYIKISREHHGCGVPTNAIYGVPDN